MDHEIIQDINSVFSYIRDWIENTPAYRRFTEVPKKKNISYSIHVWRGIKQSIHMIYIAICVWMYAFFPFLFDKEPSYTIIESDTQVLKPEEKNVSNEPTATL